MHDMLGSGTQLAKVRVVVAKCYAFHVLNEAMPPFATSRPLVFDAVKTGKACMPKQHAC